MHDGKVMTLIDELVDMDRKLAQLAVEFKAKKSEIIAEARAREDEQLPTPGGGTTWFMEGHSGNLCRVTFPAPTLRATIKPGKTLTKLQGLLGRTFLSLFQEQKVYTPVDGFRQRAKDILGPDARKVIRACETTSTTQVGFETKKKNAKAES